MESSDEYESSDYESSSDWEESYNFEAPCGTTATTIGGNPVLMKFIRATSLEHRSEFVRIEVDDQGEPVFHVAPPYTGLPINQMLPLELMLDIISYLPTHTLSKLSRTCRALNHLTTPILYSTCSRRYLVEALELPKSFDKALALSKQSPSCLLKTLVRSDDRRYWHTPTTIPAFKLAALCPNPLATVLNYSALPSEIFLKLVIAFPEELLGGWNPVWSLIPYRCDDPLTLDSLFGIWRFITGTKKGSKKDLALVMGSLAFIVDERQSRRLAKPPRLYKKYQMNAEKLVGSGYDELVLKVRAKLSRAPEKKIEELFPYPT